MDQLLAISIPDEHELLAAATIAIDEDGQYQMNLNNVVGASIAMTRSDQVRYLRMLANGIEAEATYSGDIPSTEE